MVDVQDLCYLLTAKSIHEVPSFQHWEGIQSGRERLVEQLQTMIDIEVNDQAGGCLCCSPSGI